MKKFSFFSFILSSLLVFGGGNQLMAQTPLARFVLPTSTTSTAVQDTFEIITKYKIDTSSVRWNLTWIDSTYSLLPTVCIIPSIVYSGYGDTAWPYISRTGSGTVVNDTTILFVPNPLNNGMSYEAILMGLRVISGTDTITISDTVSRLSFSTVSLPPRLTSLSIIDSGGIIRSQDTITVHFSSKLDSTNCAVGPIVSIMVPKVIRDTVHDTMLVSDSIVASSKWLDASDSSVIHILPVSPLTPGQNYAVKVGLSCLTGDSSTDGKWRFFCKKSFHLNITAAPTGGLSCLDTVHFNPPINEDYELQYDSIVSGGTVHYDTTLVRDTNFVGTMVNADDTVFYVAPLQVGGATFIKWSGSGITAIDTSTNPILTLTESPASLRDINVIALYQGVPADTVCVATAGINTLSGNADIVNVYSDSEDCPFTTLSDTCSSSTSVNYSLERGKTIMLNAYSTSSSIQFDHWSSSDSTINGQTAPMIAMQTKGNICVTANYVNVPSTPPFTIDVLIFDLTTGNYVSNSGTGVAYVTGVQRLFQASDNQTWYRTMNSDVQEFVTLNFNDPSYALEEFSITGPANTSQDVPQPYYVLPVPYTGSYSISSPPSGYTSYRTDCTSPTTVVTFYVKQIALTLTIDIALDDNYAANPRMLILPSMTNVTPNGAWVKVDQQPAAWSGHWYSGDNSHPNTYRWILAYSPLTPPVNITAGVGGNSNYTFKSWDPNTPNTNPTNPPYSAPFNNPIISGVTLARFPSATVTAIFSEPFMLESISFYHVVWNGSDRSTQAATVPAGQWGNEQLNIGAVVWDSTVPLAMTLNFNYSVGTINSSGSGYGLGYGCSMNYAGSQDAGWYVGDIDDAMSYTTSADGKSVTLNLNSPIVWKGQNGAISVGVYNSITSSTGDPLSNPGTFAFETVNPDVTWTLDWLWPTDATHPCLYLIGGSDNYTGSDINAEHNFNNLRYPGSGMGHCEHNTGYNFDPYGHNTANWQIFNLQQMPDDGFLDLRLEAITSDPNLNWIQIIVTTVSSTLDWSVLKDFLDWENWGAQVTAVGLTDDGQDIYTSTINGQETKIDWADPKSILFQLGLVALYEWCREESSYWDSSTEGDLGTMSWPAVGKLQMWGYWEEPNPDGIGAGDWNTEYGYGSFSLTAGIKAHILVGLQ